MLTVRLATLNDCLAIVSLYRLRRPELQADDLTLYERWQAGGPCLSIETCAVHLNRLLASSAVPLVVEEEGRLLGYAEVYESWEPSPFGHHLHIGVFEMQADVPAAEDALIRYVIQMAQIMKCERLTIGGERADGFYDTFGFRASVVAKGVKVSAQEGRAFYKASDLIDRSYEQVKGWYMTLGRYQTSRQEWDHLFPQDWAAGLPELISVAVLHLRLTVTGQNAIMYLREAEEPGAVSVTCWSMRPLSNALLMSIRDRVYRDGYQTVITSVLESDLVLFGNDAHLTGFSQQFYELSL